MIRKPVPIRLDEELIARIEALRPHLSTAARDATLSDVLRMLVLSGLDVLEQENAATLAELRERDGE